jgi:hypothetical protein
MSNSLEAFGGVVGRTYRDSTPWRPEKQKPKELVMRR